MYIYIYIYVYIYIYIYIYIYMVGLDGGDAQRQIGPPNFTNMFDKCVALTQISALVWLMLLLGVSVFENLWVLRSDAQAVNDSTC